MAKCGDSAVETTRKREAIKKRYPSSEYAKRVNLMPPDQVAAIYARLTANSQLKR